MSPNISTKSACQHNIRPRYIRYTQHIVYLCIGLSLSLPRSIYIYIYIHIYTYIPLGWFCGHVGPSCLWRRLQLCKRSVTKSPADSIQRHCSSQHPWKCGFLPNREASREEAMLGFPRCSGVPIKDICGE